MDGITQATLTRQLRMLEDFGLINRHVYSEIPPKVEYSLTDLGKEFKPVIITHLQAHLYRTLSLSISNWSPLVHASSPLE